MCLTRIVTVQFGYVLNVYYSMNKSNTRSIIRLIAFNYNTNFFYKKPFYKKPRATEAKI